MVTIEELEEDECLSLYCKNSILMDLAGEVIEEISETRELMMDEIELIQIENLIAFQVKMEKETKENEEIYEKTQKKNEEEKVKLEKELEDFLEVKIEEKRKLMEINRKEKENRVNIEKIFDIVRNWTDIDFVFSQLLGMREALKSTKRLNENNENHKRNTEKIEHRMLNRVHYILKLHKSNVKLVKEVLESINAFLDFVELGMNESYRTGLVIVLNSMKNIPFWTLKEESCMDRGIDHIQETVREIRDQFFKLPLCQLRSRKSIRQLLWDEIDSFDISVDFEKLKIK
ncbi:hypothetical protein GCK72_013905 [Caenorhabditis remanei]|uniref:Uncharacterized protein n=1 Tax=Caenorhabditis remanei TaxID=31234 RepID=A0A6A5GSJ3_CAERE|nr:hypothetical protein GCK72_013905 [Caenorhabditis remanei]KAF1757449.1 hypothetical protein GCK72_013905 [Caenorhabditis remanei]